MRGDRKQTLRGCGSCTTVLRYQQPSDVGGRHSADHALSSSHCPARRLACCAAALIARLPESAGVQASTYMPWCLAWNFCRGKLCSARYVHFVGRFSVEEWVKCRQSWLHRNTLHAVLSAHDHEVNFLSTSQEIGWEEHLRNELFCVKWDVKP